MLTGLIVAADDNHNTATIPFLPIDFEKAYTLNEPTFLCNGFPFNSPEGQKWIATRLDKSNITSLLEGVQPFLQTQPQLPKNPDSSLALSLRLSQSHVPDEAFVRRCLAFYRSTSLFLAFPVVDPLLFEETITEVYSSRASAGICTTRAKTCVLTFLCFQALFRSTRDSEEIHIEHEDLFLELRRSVWLDCQDVTLESLEVFVMMVGSLSSTSCSLSILDNLQIGKISTLMST
jgi:hypothetical protein